MGDISVVMAGKFLYYDRTRHSIINSRYNTKKATLNCKLFPTKCKFFRANISRKFRLTTFYIVNFQKSFKVCDNKIIIRLCENILFFRT